MKITASTQWRPSLEATLALSLRERQILALRRGMLYAHSDLYEEARKLGVSRARVDEIKGRAEMMLMSKITKEGLMTRIKSLEIEYT